MSDALSSPVKRGRGTARRAVEGARCIDGATIDSPEFGKAPTTMLRMVPLPCVAGEDGQAATLEL
jgi:hypothetical protein